MARGLRMTEEQYAKRITGIARVSPTGKVGKMQTTDIPLKPSKYKNVKTEVDGIKFDSKKEAKRWQELKLLEASGEIDQLMRQIKYELIPSYKFPTERAVNYVADFVYLTRVGEAWTWIVEDAKGMRTPDYVIKRKLMRHVHGVIVREV